MNMMPAMMTNSTMNSFTATSTRLTRSDSLMPRSSGRRARERAGSPAGRPRRRKRSPGQDDADLLEEGAEVGAPPLSDDARAEEHLQDQVPPDDHANSSPSEAYENVYADPDTGTVEANSA